MARLYAAAAVGFVLAVAASPAAAQQALPGAFFGQFRGTLADSTGQVTGEFNVTIKKTSAGFAVSWPPRVSASFEPAGRPGLFQTREKSKMLSGEPVHWARLEGGALTVYDARITDQGGYVVDTFQYMVAPDGLDLFASRVLTGAEPQISSGRLNRYGAQD